MAQSLTLLPWLHLSKKNAQGDAPIYIRLTYNNKRAELSTSQFIKPAAWNPDKKRVKSSHKDAQSINDKIEDLLTQIKDVYKELIRKGDSFTAETIKAIMLRPIQQVSLIQAIEEHNEKLLSQVGKTYAQNTYKNYYFLHKKITAFPLYHYKRSDILLEELDFQFILNFEHYLISHDGVGQHTANKYLTKLKKIINMALDHGWIVKSPIRRQQSKHFVIKRDFLTQAELETIETLDLVKPHLVKARDLFLFQCYTGLSYVDMKAFDSSRITVGMDGQCWIILNRRKTGTRSVIPLLSKAKEILDKYDHILPVISNQKLNKYLKKIAESAGIHKRLTSHAGRRTFATTIAYANGVPLETISYILGHSAISVTQKYAIIDDHKIAKDLKGLFEKY